MDSATQDQIINKRFNIWMPVTKSKDDKLVAILSDTSVDRDGEFMTKELLEDWSRNRTLPALMNHENKMKSWIGGWKGFKVIKKGKNHALIATPFFFSTATAKEIQQIVNDAIDNGLNPGISIGAIAREYVEKEIDGSKHIGYSKADLVEATWVPVQSNPHASFGHIAKQFGFIIKQENEVKEMSDENKQDVQPKEPETKQDEKQEMKEEKNQDVDVLKSQIEELQKNIELQKKEISKLSRTSVNLPKSHETMKEAVEKKTDEPVTISKMWSLTHK